MIFPYEQWIAAAPGHHRATGLPLVSLAYAQSLDGCIAAYDGSPLAISGRDALRLTHRLRAAHDSILVGIGTVLSDDPDLTVRFCDGKQPQPIILDSKLRILQHARLLSPDRLAPKPWIATYKHANPEKRHRLEELGIHVIDIPLEDNGNLRLEALLKTLGQSGINSVMVEGGAQVLCSFVKQKLADIMIVTIAPSLLAGLRSIPEQCFESGDQLGNGRLSLLNYPRLSQVGYHQLEDNIVLWGRLKQPHI